MPVQETDSYSLTSPVQDIRPEMLKGFGETMDKEDVWGNEWKRWVYFFHYVRIFLKNKIIQIFLQIMIMIIVV